VICASSWNYILEYYNDARIHEHLKNIRNILKCSISYQPGDDPLGPKHVAVKITKSKAVLTVCAY
jgi:hypothetical protein